MQSHTRTEHTILIHRHTHTHPHWGRERMDSDRQGETDRQLCSLLCGNLYVFLMFIGVNGCDLDETICTIN